MTSRIRAAVQCRENPKAKPAPAWTFRQDQTIKGWPYLFESPVGAQLWINASWHNDISGWDFTVEPPELSTEQKKCFLLTASDAAQLDRKAVDLFKMSQLKLAAMQFMLGPFLQQLQGWIGSRGQ